MSDRVLVATRKGLFVCARDAAGWRVEQRHFLGDHVCQLLVDQRDGHWYAALDLGHFGAKLQVSRDQGGSWQELAVPAYAEGDEVQLGDGKPPRPATLVKLWSLAAGGSQQSGRLWAGTIPGGLFRSDDHGQHWQLVRGLWDRPERREWFGGGYDEPGIHSICVHPLDPRRLMVAISTGGIWRSEDEGEHWSSSARGMFNEYMPPDQRENENVQDVHCMVQCAAQPEVCWAQHHNAAFLSRDGGRSWQSLAVPPSVFGFAVAAHPQKAGTAWFVPAVKDEKRYPVDGQLVVARTRDHGASFELLRSGLPVEESYDLVYRHGLAVDASGQRLAFGSTTGGVWLSEDEGEHWQALPARLPPVYAVAFA